MSDEYVPSPRPAPRRAGAGRAAWAALTCCSAAAVCASVVALRWRGGGRPPCADCLRRGVWLGGREQKNGSALDQHWETYGAGGSFMGFDLLHNTSTGMKWLMRNCRLWGGFTPPGESAMSRWRSADPPPARYDMYQFGVYTGCSMRQVTEWMRQKDIDFGTIWGFDSFQGLPREHDGMEVEQNWKEGAYSTADAWGTHSWAQVRKRLLQYIGDDRTRLVRGYFGDTLTPALRRRLRPAMYVDVDSDLYLSAMDALDFLFCERLMMNGTLLYYDDLFRWDEGEGLAHLHLTMRHSIEWDELTPVLWIVRSYTPGQCSTRWRAAHLPPLSGVPIRLRRLANASVEHWQALQNKTAKGPHKFKRHFAFWMNVTRCPSHPPHCAWPWRLPYQ